jgi:ribosome recycling factor
MKDLNKLESENNKVILALKRDLEKIRTGKVTPSILDSVYVDYWGKSIFSSKESDIMSI